MANTDLTASDVIRLDIPAAAQFLATARVVATAAGADAGLSVDDLDDLRLGVGELTGLLIDRARRGGRLALAVEVRDGAIVVTGELDEDVDVTDDSPVDELAERILSAVADAYELTGRAFRLEKSASNRAR